jgi:hypothetical protein
MSKMIYTCRCEETQDEYCASLCNECGSLTKYDGVAQ